MTPSKPWLGIDTATDLASVAVGVPPAVLGTASVRGARRHGTEIVRLIDDVLSTAGVRPNELGGIVVGDGPGSFTGLRIGWAAAKGLSHERGLELRAVPSLMAAAALAARDLGPVPVAACYDALRGEVYGAVYVAFPGRVETLVAPAVVTIAALAGLAPVRPRLAVGDGAVRYAAEVQAWLGVAPVALEDLPGGGALAATLLTLLLRNGAARPLDDGLTAEPVYGRLAEAQVKWEARHGRPLSDSHGSDR